MRTFCFAVIFLWGQTLWAQAPAVPTQRVVVTDENNLPLPGVAVITRDGFGGSTGLDGSIRIPADKIHREFEFSYLGYEPVQFTFLALRNRHYKLMLRPAQKLLDEVVVVGRTDARKDEIPYQVEKISDVDIAFLNPSTTAYALEQSGQVFVQRSQTGGGSPVLRGFEANKLLLVVDGVRMNNAIYRSGHLQNSITIDNSSLDKLEVIFGPGSLMYGSDAIGGVIHFRTRRPSILTKDDLADHRTAAAGYMRFASANLEKTAHVDFDHARHKFGMFSSITFSHFSDLRTGKKRPAAYPDFGKNPYYVLTDNGADQVVENANPDIIPNSGYWQLDVINKLRFQLRPNFEWGFNFQVSTSSIVPRNDKLSIIQGDPQRLKFAEWYYGPQLRFMTASHIKWIGRGRIADKVKLIASYQRINEDRYKRKFGKARRTFQLEDVHVFAVTLDAEKKLNKAGTLKLLYGGEYDHNIVHSMAGKVDIHTNETSGHVFTRYPSGGSDLSANGTYAILQLRTRDTALTFNAGLRYSGSHLQAHFKEGGFFSWPHGFYKGLNNTNSAWTWGLGGTWRTPAGFQLRGLVATAFRAPNLDDFGKIREKNGYITVPNPGLRPEHSLQREITIGQFFRKRAYYASGRQGMALNVYLTAFQSDLRDAIIVDTFPAPDGSIFIEPEPGDKLRTTASINADSAVVRGLSLNAEIYLGPHWETRASWNLTKGESVSGGVRKPMAHIPPAYGKVEVSYTYKRYKLSGVLRYNGFKDIADFGPGTADNPQKTYPEGALAWHTYNVYCSINLRKHYSVQLAIENLADLHYRPFASGVSAPGRNFLFTLRKNFGR